MTREGTCSSDGSERREITLDAQEYAKFQQDPHSYLGVDADEYDLKITVVVIDDLSPSIAARGKEHKNDARTATNVAATASEKCKATTSQVLHYTRAELVLESGKIPCVAPPSIRAFASSHPTQPILSNCSDANDELLSDFDIDNMNDDDGNSCASSSSGSTVESTECGTVRESVDSQRAAQHDASILVAGKGPKVLSGTNASHQHETLEWAVYMLPETNGGVHSSTQASSSPGNGRMSLERNDELRYWDRDSSSMGCTDADDGLNFTSMVDSRTRVREPLARTKCGFLTAELRERLCRCILDRCFETSRLERGVAIEIADRFQIASPTVDVMWKRILESSMEGDTIVVILKHHGPQRSRDIELTISHPAVPKLLARRSKMKPMSDHPNAKHQPPSLSPHADLSVIDKSGYAGATCCSALPRADDEAPGASKSEHLAQSTQEAMCQALVGRCLPSGRLEKYAAKEIAGQFGVNVTSVYSNWKGLLATTGTDGEVFKKRGPKSWGCSADELSGTLEKLGESGSVFPLYPTTRRTKTFDDGNIGSGADDAGSTDGPSLARNGIQLTEESRELVCQALLDNCLPSGRLSGDVIPKLAHYFDINPNTVRTIWNCILASVSATGTIDANYGKGDNRWYPDLDREEAYTVLQKVLAKQNGWTEEQLAQSALAPRARRISTSGQGSRERMCNSLLDRCRPNGRLERNALQEVADQYKVNRMIVQAAWKRMLASVVETGIVDPYYKKEKTQSWVPNVNYDKAYPAMQKVLAERQKSATCDAMSLTNGKVPQKSAMDVKPNAETSSYSSMIGEKPLVSPTKMYDLADDYGDDIVLEDWEKGMEPDGILSRQQHRPQKGQKRRKVDCFDDGAWKDKGTRTEDWKDVLEPDVVPSIQHHLQKRKQLDDFDDCSSYLNEASLHSNDEQWTT